jgi:hypothetical protein
MINNFKVTSNFSYYELTNTKEHPDLLNDNRVHFAIQPYIGRLTCATEYLLENTRDEIDCPIIVLSGGRSPELNKAVGGVQTSQHLFERHNDGAFDITVPNMAIGAVAEAIWFSGLSFFQMRVYVNRNFVHLGMPRAKDNRQVYWIGDNCPIWAKSRMV